MPGTPTSRNIQSLRRAVHDLHTSYARGDLRRAADVAREIETGIGLIVDGLARMRASSASTTAAKEYSYGDDYSSSPLF